LDAAGQLFDVYTGKRPLATCERRRALEALGQLVDAAARTIDHEAEIAFALEPANAEHVAQTMLEIDVGELQLRLEIGSAARLGQSERPFDYAAEGLGFAHRHGQVAAAQMCRHRRAPELGTGDSDARRRQSESEVDAVA